MKKLSVLFSIVALAATVAALVVIAARYFARRRELYDCCDCGEYCDDCCDCYEDEVDGDLAYSAELAVDTSDDDPDASSNGEAVPEE